jgi:hypothetical protein
MQTLNVLCLLCVLWLTSCRAAPLPSLLTETRGGEPMIQRTIEKTGSRRDVPVNKKPREVVAQSKFNHRGGVGYISITRSWWPWASVQVSTNCLNCHKTEPIPFTRPKDPWWKWPVLVLIAVGTALVLYFLEQIKRLIFFWRR